MGFTFRFLVERFICYVFGFFVYVVSYVLFVSKTKSAITCWIGMGYYNTLCRRIVNTSLSRSCIKTQSQLRLGKMKNKLIILCYIIFDRIPIEYITLYYYIPTHSLTPEPVTLNRTFKSFRFI